MSGQGAVSTVGDAFEALISDQIAFERTKKSSLETRGIAVITTAGTLVTLLLALAAVITKATSYTPPSGARTLLIVAVVIFLAAAILGIFCNAPVLYDEIDPKSLSSLTTKGAWAEPGTEARRQIAEAQLSTLTNWRAVNQTKGLVLAVAAIVEVLGVIATGAAAAVILVHG